MALTGWLQLRVYPCLRQAAAAIGRRLRAPLAAMAKRDPDIRVLGTEGIEDHHAHLLRLDEDGRRLCAGSDDERALESHSLRLLDRRAILVGAYVDGVLRASVEIIPDRCAREADANFTVEMPFHDAALERALLARAIKEARSYRLFDLKLHGLDDEAELVRAATADVLGQRSALALSAGQAASG
jgi:hypothetical protein